MEYIMGNNPMNRCYIVDIPKTVQNILTIVQPMVPRHSACWILKNTVIHCGGIGGSPDLDDFHVDETTDYVYNEVAVDYNAAFVGACAGLYYYYGEALGHKPVPNFPPKEEAVEEYYVEGKIEQENKERTR